MRRKYEKDSAQYSSWKGMMGPRGKVDETTRHIAAAAAWGLFPEWDATYLNYKGAGDPKSCQKATYRVPENDAFWSITVYGVDGYMRARTASSTAPTPSSTTTARSPPFLDPRRAAATSPTASTSPTAGTSSCASIGPARPCSMVRTNCPPSKPRGSRPLLAPMGSASVGIARSCHGRPRAGHPRGTATNLSPAQTSVSSEAYNKVAVFSWMAGSSPAMTEKRNTSSPTPDALRAAQNIAISRNV
jgi:hypothetical protein